jgi:hypothetical protein
MEKQSLPVSGGNSDCPENAALDVLEKTCRDLAAERRGGEEPLGERRDLFALENGFASQPSVPFRRWTWVGAGRRVVLAGTTRTSSASWFLALMEITSAGRRFRPGSAGLSTQ